jgi:hypothetical protein
LFGQPFLQIIFASVSLEGGGVSFVVVDQSGDGPELAKLEALRIVFAVYCCEAH